MLREGLAGLAGAGHRLCIVGSGPVGLALATELARRGMRVLVLESGAAGPDARVQALSDAEILNPARHDGMDVAVARQLGGTSNLWGARCLPFDPIDFESRDWVDARWPIAFADLAPWIAPACAVTRSGAPVYSEPIEGFTPADDAFDCAALERWANVQQAQHIHAEAIAGDPRIDLRSHATLTGLRFAESGAVAGIEVVHTLSGERATVPIETLVLAAGGLETARLLLAARRDAPERFGGAEGPLGRHYMGHIVGEIADVTLGGEAIDRAFPFRVDAHGSYVRRRLVASAATQRAYRLLNTALWPIVPPIADARHGSAILSMVYLAMRWPAIGARVVAEAIRRAHAPVPPPPLGPHLRNLVAGAPSAAAFGIDFLRRRYDRETRLPGFFLRNRARRYGLTYHAEQLPKADSRIWLGGGSDRLGLPHLVIDYRVHADDAASVVSTHDRLEAWMAATGFGRLDYRVPHAERAAVVLAHARHGTHQIGLARMGAHRREGVVDGDLACFDAPNLHIASTAVLPTSGQANPTLTTIALALRLAARLAQGSAAPVLVAA